MSKPTSISDLTAGFLTKAGIDVEARAGLSEFMASWLAESGFEDAVVQSYRFEMLTVWVRPEDRTAFSMDLEHLRRALEETFPDEVYDVVLAHGRK